MTRLLRAVAVAVVLCALSTACAGDDAGDAAVESGESVITLEEFASGPQARVGQTVTLENVQVASRMGEHAFWIEFPNETPYLVKLEPALTDGGLSVASGERYRITGRVVTMTDSVLAAWQDSGAITDEGQMAEAQFATSFLEVQSAERTAAAGGEAQQ